MSDTRFVLVAPNLPAAKAWCAERRIHSDHPIVVTPHNAAKAIRGVPPGLDLVVIHRGDDGMVELLVEVGLLIQSGHL